MQLEKEIQLLTNIKNGDRSAFEELFRFYHHDAYDFIIQKKVGSQVAEYLLIDSFVKLWRSRTALNERNTLEEHLLLMAEKSIRDYLNEPFAANISGRSTSGMMNQTGEAGTQQRKLNERLKELDSILDKELPVMPIYRSAGFKKAIISLVVAMILFFLLYILKLNSAN